MHVKISTCSHGRTMIMFPKLRNVYHGAPTCRKVSISGDGHFLTIRSPQPQPLGEHWRKYCCLLLYFEPIVRDTSRGSLRRGLVLGENIFKNGGFIC